MRKSVLIVSVVAVAVVVLALSLNLGGLRDMFSGGTSGTRSYETGATVQQSRISAGRCHTLCVDKDGSLWAWGQNEYGQIGTGKGGDSKEPLPVRVSKPQGMGNVVSISAGGYHSLALCEDGSLWAWGWNYFGQLGNGKGGEEDSKVLLPVRVLKPEGMGDVVAISAGRFHSLALCEDGSLWAWGDNEHGQSGNGKGGEWESKELLPVRVSKPEGMGEVLAISSGLAHNLALCEDGSLWAWGYNVYDQIGNGGKGTEELLPVRVSKPEGMGTPSPSPPDLLTTLPFVKTARSGPGAITCTTRSETAEKAPKSFCLSA
ncbi:MAG: hypothetical protein U5N86_04435 [Planctomycetota bacterium]|nr:hypothetical protein [Planctomycetota bacterium]